jgi:hypothetical protein
MLCALPFDYRALIGMSNVAVAVQYLLTCLAVFKFQRGKARGLRTLWPWVGAAVSLWIFTEASSTELVWAAASLAVGALVVTLTRRAAASAPVSP